MLDISVNQSLYSKGKVKTMDKYTLNKVYRFNVPDTQGDSWQFEFKVAFRQHTETLVRAEWTCLGLGNGTFYIEDVDITWTCLLVAWNTFADLAHNTVRGWNIEEEASIKMAMGRDSVIPDQKLSTTTDRDTYV